MKTTTFNQFITFQTKYKSNLSRIEIQQMKINLQSIKLAVSQFSTTLTSQLGQLEKKIQNYSPETKHLNALLLEKDMVIQNLMEQLDKQKIENEILRSQQCNSDSPQIFLPAQRQMEDGLAQENSHLKSQISQLEASLTDQKLQNLQLQQSINGEPKNNLLKEYRQLDSKNQAIIYQLLQLAQNCSACGDQSAIQQLRQQVADLRERTTKVKNIMQEFQEVQLK